jgi:glycosyltransferase involved in cell wall biosynthesis
MRIGLLTTGFPRFEGDHSGAFLLTLVRACVAHGYEVRVLTPEPKCARPIPRWPGIDVRWIPYLRPRALQQTFYGFGAPDNLRRQRARWLGAATFTAALVPAARRTLEDCDTLVSSWCLPCGWVASKVADGRDHLCICHATDVRWLSGIPAGGRLARAIAAGATAMWFLSPSHRDRYFATAGLPTASVPTHLGPMPIDPPRRPDQSRAALRRELGIECFTILFLGRLVPVKGVDRLLRAAAAVDAPLCIRIAGDGPEREKLASLARRLGVDATFEGWVAGARKEALLRACDAIVIPSRAMDGLPTVLFEARARALPIIATRAGAIADHLTEDGRAWLVPPDDPNALAKVIRERATKHAGLTA